MDSSITSDCNPKCRNPELATGLRSHADAGGVVVILQDDTVPGLEFLKGSEWIPVTTTKENMICVNFGDQIEIVSNGVYKSIMHRVLVGDNGVGYLHLLSITLGIVLSFLWLLSYCSLVDTDLETILVSIPRVNN